MSENVLMQYPNEHLLKWKQIFVHVSDSLKKLATGGKIEPLGSQRVGHESGHPGATWLKHLVMPSRTRKCSQHVPLHLEE
jgi:hypothetical protein